MNITTCSYMDFNCLLFLCSLAFIANVVSEDVAFLFHDPVSENIVNVTQENVRTILNITNNATIIIHGFNEGGKERWINKMASVINEHVKSMNVIAVDYGSIANGYKIFAIWKLTSVADKIVEFVRSSGLNLESVHLVGFDVGGHVAGMAGHRLGGDKLGRITGLDVSGAVFERFLKFIPFTGAWRLTWDDAIFVDAIHTSATPFKGALLPVGDTDFYINRGVIQPKCFGSTFEVFTCSHHLAHTYFSLTIMNPTKYPASKQYNNKPVYMGWNATRAPGVWYVKAGSTGVHYTNM